ncbi:MAG: Selenoprotein O and cysteine-containing homologs [uncultured Sulfurovum sp.]|uniref:Protein nucleotidyltransferase YdiU n=1 Tax=uncultured Sulfurovum sp. TaxID=269237 RepID=A0A6S6TRU4_9BACT|nr:MAG: Selenoprotein O and cysteine-containing homologs [uncultured Sulfurovum sp.]
MTLDKLQFETKYLSLDPEFYELTKPIPLNEPYFISFNPEVAELIDLDEVRKDDATFLKLLNGTFIPESAKTFAMCYAGHQFSHYAIRLGDGRAINYGSINGWNIQTKGSGETAYSRTADGRAALPSSIREYLMSEAMHHLGIPSTRALGIIGSQTKLLRNTIEKGAIIMRLSPSWIRFGTFEYFSYLKEYDKLKSLTDYAITESYPHLENKEDRYYQFFSEVVERTAKLIAHWQGVGFCHGVMNTDNMSIAGLTLDYGPFSMLDDFDFGFVCNSTDKAGRYAYGEQPNISYWNLTKFSKALAPIIDVKKMEQKLEDYGSFIYPNAYIKVMRQKMGLEFELNEDMELIENLVGTLQDAYIDHTIFFRTLSHYDGERMPIFELAMNPVPLDTWLTLYDKRLEKETRTHTERQNFMLKTNPKYVLKNYMLQDAIALTKGGNFSRVEELLYIAQHPFDELPEFEKFAVETPEHYKNVTLSCSS